MPTDKPKRQTHADFTANDSHFNDMCALAKVKPTRRQASKFRTRRGLAFAASQQVRMAVLNGGESDFRSVA